MRGHLCDSTAFLLGRRVISPLRFRLNNTEGFDFICCNKKYTGDTHVYVYVIKKYCSKSIGIGIGNTFFHEVLVLVSAILFETSIGIGIANTFKKYC